MPASRGDLASFYKALSVPKQRSFDPVRPPNNRPRDADRWRGEADGQFQPSRASCFDITVLVTERFANCARLTRQTILLRAMDTPNSRYAACRISRRVHP